MRAMASPSHKGNCMGVSVVCVCVCVRVWCVCVCARVVRVCACACVVCGVCACVCVCVCGVCGDSRLCMWPDCMYAYMVLGSTLLSLREYG